MGVSWLKKQLLTALDAAINQEGDRERCLLDTYRTVDADADSDQCIRRIHMARIANRWMDVSVHANAMRMLMLGGDNTGSNTCRNLFWLAKKQYLWREGGFLLGYGKEIWLCTT